MTNQEFQKKYSFSFFRCDSCGGNAKECCDYPYPIEVNDCDTEKLVKDGASVSYGNMKTTYSIKVGEKQFSVTRLNNGWGAEW